MIEDTLVTIEVDGLKLQAKPGTMLIELTDAAGIDIPRFCYHNKLSVAANCRMCLVEVERAPKPLPACATPIASGMKVKTRSSLALAAQRGTMEFLLINHPLDCPICDQGGECELQDLAMGYGQDYSRYLERKRVVQDNDIGPLIATDMTRCIHCTRCVRFGEEIAGIRELGSTGRGEHTRIGTFVERSVDSELSGNVIDLCPVGALTAKPSRFHARAWELQQRSIVASHDSVGSNVRVHVRRNRVMRVHSGENEAINEVWISDRDRFSYEGLYSSDRLARPMVKQDGVWRDVDWTFALGVAVRGMAEAAKHGANGLATLISPRSTLEELYLARKLTLSLGSPLIDHRLRQGDFRGDLSEPRAPWLGMSIAELEQVHTLFVIGSNLRKEQPLLNHRVRKAALRGAKIFYLNPLSFELNYSAEQLLASPIQMLEQLGALAKLVGARVEGAASDLMQAIEPTTKLRELAECLRQAQHKAVLVGPLAQAHPDYAVLRDLAHAIAMSTGAIMGFIPIGANTVGANMIDATVRTTVDDQIGGIFSERKRAAYLLFGIEPQFDCGNPALAMTSLGAAEHVVAVTAFRSPGLARVATVLLPLAELVETSGTYVNAAGTWQQFSAAVTPPEDAKPGWKILRVLGTELGLTGFNQLSSEEILDEIYASLGGLSLDTICGRSGVVTLRTKADALMRVGDVPMYATDPLVRRAVALQTTRDAGIAAVGLSEVTAERYGLKDGGNVWFDQGGDRVCFSVKIDSRVPDHCAWLPAGISGTEGLGGQFAEARLERG